MFILTNVLTVNKHTMIEISLTWDWWLSFLKNWKTFSYWNEKLLEKWKSVFWENFLQEIEEKINEFSARVINDKAAVKMLNDFLDLRIQQIENVEIDFDEDSELDDLIETITRENLIVISSKDERFKWKINLLEEKWLAKRINKDYAFVVNLMFWDKLTFESNFWQIIWTLMNDYYWLKYIVSWKDALRLHAWYISKSLELNVRVEDNIKWNIELPFWFVIKVRKSKFETDFFNMTQKNIRWTFMNVQWLENSLVESIQEKEDWFKEILKEASVLDLDTVKLKRLYDNDRPKEAFKTLEELYFNAWNKQNYLKILNVVWKRVRENEDVFWTFVDWYNYEQEDLNSIDMNKSYVKRYKEKIKIYLQQLNYSEKDFKLKTKDELFNLIEVQKIEETYHSTTIEWYRMTKEEVKAVINWKASESNVASFFEIKWYSDAINYIKQLVEENQEMKQEEIRRTRAILFSRWKVDLNYYSYSRENRYIKNLDWWMSKHIPPSSEKIQDLMDLFENEIRKIKDWWKRAIIAHVLFVDIHPFSDWNWRTWRLLMNYHLVNSWIWWAIVREDEREEFFRTLESAQTENRISDFEEFIKKRL